jgi:hypothetical protein
LEKQVLDAFLKEYTQDKLVAVDEDFVRRE